MTHPVPPASPDADARRQPAWPWLVAAIGLLLVLGLCFHEGLRGTAAIDTTPFLRGQDALYAEPGQRVTFLAYDQKDPSPQLQHQPWDSLIMAAFREGRWPLWQPHNGFGTPLMGNGQSGVFNPLKLVLLGGLSSVTVAWFLVLRLAVGGLGALLLARRLGLSVWAATLAAGCFALSGFFAYNLYYPQTHTLVFLPWLLLVALRLADRPALGSAALLGLAIGGIGVVGHPEAAVFAAMAASFVYGLEVLVRPQRARLLALFSLALALGAALAAVFVVPLLELASHSRSYLLEKGTTGPGELTPQTTVVALWRHLLSGQALPHPYYFNPFVGAVALALMPLGLAHQGVRRVVFGLLACAAVILALCEPSQVIHILPVTPKSYYGIGLVSLGLGLLAGGGLDRLLEARSRRPGLIAAGVAGGAMAISFLVQARVDAFYRQTGYPQWTGEYQLTLLALGATLAVLLIHLARPLARPLLAGALLLVAGAHLGSAVRVAAPPRPALGYPVTPVMAYLKANLGAFRVAGAQSALLPNSNAVHGLDSIELEDPFPSRRFVGYHQLLNRLPAPEIGTEFVLRPDFDPGMLDLASVRYLLVAQAPNGQHLRQVLAEHPARYPVVARQPGVTVHENRTALPRARVVYDAEFARQGDPGVGERLRLGGERWRAAVLVETTDGLPVAGWRNQAGPPTEASYERPTPDSARIQARLSRPGWLVVGDAAYPGWNAYIDGHPAPIYPANMAMRAVLLGPGNHEVTFRYEPRTMRWGGLISVLALALALIGVAWAPMRRWGRNRSARA